MRCSRYPSVTATAAALLLCAATSRAAPQDAPPEAKPAGAPAKPEPKLVAPKQVSAPPVPYPKDASGTATVTLELVIAANGNVDRVTVIDGDEPFAEAARGAALDWKFEAATKDGVAVRAIIHAKVDFTPPTSTTPVEPPPGDSGTKPADGNGTKPNTTTPKKPTSADLEPIEVVVEGERVEVGGTTIGGGEVRILPGAFGDPFRAIEAMPGVTPIVSGIPFFFIRGAPPGNAGYFIDGIRVPLLFHLGAGPSVLAPGLIDHVDFHPGGYPARYGRFSGGVIAGETKEPGRFRGEWNVRLFDASAMVESPIGKPKEGEDGKLGPAPGTALVAGRFGYPGLLLSLFSPEIGLQYWDYQVRAGYNVNEKDRVSVFFFGAFDRLTQTKTVRTYDTTPPPPDGTGDPGSKLPTYTERKVTTVLFGVQFHRGDLRYDHEISGGHLRAAATFGFDQTSLGDDNCGGGSATFSGSSTGGSNCTEFAIRMYSVGVRVELEKRLSPDVKLRSGADFGIERYSLVTSNDSSSDIKDIARNFPTRVDTFGGVRSDLILKPAPTVEIIPGVRLDIYSSKTTVLPAIEPRLATRVSVTKKVDWISTMAVAQQPPSFIVPVPGLRLGGLDGGLQKAFQFAEGIEARLPWKSSVKLVGFYHAYLKLSDVISTCAVDDRPTQPGQGGCEIDDRATGRAYGLELLVKRALTESFGGWLSYTLSRTDRTYKGDTFVSAFDRTHVVALVASYDLGVGWRFGGRFSYVTGRPAYQKFYGFSGSPGPGGDSPPPPGTRSVESALGVDQTVRLQRLPDFYRLDVRLEKVWHLGPQKWIAFTVEWFNATLKKEAVSWKNCNSATRSCNVEEIGPVTIPSLGLEGAF